MFCILFVAGMIYPRQVVADLKAEIAELKQALEAERDRGSTAAAAASATKDILAAIQLGRHLSPGPGP